MLGRFSILINQQHLLFLLARQGAFLFADCVQAIHVKQLEIVQSWSLLSFLGSSVCSVRLHATRWPSSIHGFAEIFVHIVVALPLPLGEIDKVPSRLVLVAIILAVKGESVNATFVFWHQTEIGQVVLGVGLQLGLHALGLFSSLGNECVNVV